MGMRTGIELTFGLHHLAHAHNSEISHGDHLGGQDIESMRRQNKART
jgi:enoyl-CoA hydratase